MKRKQQRNQNEAHRCVSERSWLPVLALGCLRSKRLWKSYDTHTDTAIAYNCLSRITLNEKSWVRKNKKATKKPNEFKL